MVTGSAWRKNNLRQLTHSLGRYLAILAIVALGVGFFTGLKVARPAMLLTGDRYLHETDLYDYRLISTLGLTQADAEYFAGLSGVTAAEGAHSEDFIADSETGERTLKALTLSDKINQPKLTAGRLPRDAGECLADSRRFSEDMIGTTLTVTQTATEDAFTVSEFTIVGLCESPLYMGVDRGTTSLGGGTINAFVILPQESFRADYFTEIYLTVDGTENEIYSDAYNDAVDSIKPTLTRALEERAALRYEDIIDDAREQLADAQKQYDENEAEYRTEREKAENELADAQAKLEQAQTAISANRTKLDEAEKTLEQGRKELADGKTQYEAGLAEFEAAKQDALSQLDAAQTELDAQQAKLDEGMAQIDDSGILVQHEALLISQNQLLTRLEQETEGSAEYLFYKGLLDAVELAIEQFEKSEPYQAYLTLLDAQSQLDAAQAALDEKRAEAEGTLAEKQAELDEAKAKLDESEKALETGEQELKDGRAALVSAQAELDSGRAEYESARAEAEERFADAEKQLADGKRQLDDAQVEVEKLEHPDTYLLDRETNSGYVSYHNDTSIVDGVAKVFPLFFFAVAALVCMTTMTRMIDEQRTQIGTLKSLGYGDGTIAWKYMSYSGSAAMLGCLAGYALGTWLFPAVIWEGYSMLYGFAPIEYVFDGRLLLIAIGASLLCSAGVTWLACRSELNRMPAALMRPKAPKAGKRILLERIPFLWNRFSFLYKVSVRNIVRYKKRLIMMLLGIGGCTTLIVAGLGLRDSISNVVDDQFTGVTCYDIAVSFSTPMDSQRQQEFREAYPEMTRCAFVETAAYEALGDNGISNVNVVATDDPDISYAIRLHDGERIIDYPSEGAVIDSRLADTLGLKVGDSLPLHVSDTETVEVPITDICDNYVYHYAFVSSETYTELFGKECSDSTAYVLTDGDPYALGAKLTEASRVGTVTVSEALREMVNNTMTSLNYIIALVVGCACALALVVLFNLCNISITERVREIATVKVLGFYRHETMLYVFREILILTMLGAAVGLPFGKLLHAFIMSEIRIDMVSFNIRVAPLSYVLAFAITVLLGGLVCLCLIRKIDRVNMAESLKSVE